MEHKISSKLVMISTIGMMLVLTQNVSGRDGMRVSNDLRLQAPSINRVIEPRNRVVDNNETNVDDANITEVNVGSKEMLGEALFNDTSLSLSRGQSCASCHNPNQAFVDTRDNGVDGAVSLGDNGISLGIRNAPMVNYASFSPSFSAVNNLFVGGQFWDGRAEDLAMQAQGPFLNPVEMQMPDEQSVVARVQENAVYIELFEALYGDEIFDNTHTAFEAIANAIATFEGSDAMATFDSKLDQANARIVRLTVEERRGQQLFRQNRCVTCHSDRGENALFTNFRYENIGIPKNTIVSAVNGTDIGFVDHGLLDNPNVNVTRADGRFKVPSLRNVAITAPYMHNGKFQNLKTVVHFYNTRDVAGAINPETGLAWEASEIIANRVAGNRVGNLGLSDADEDAIVAFLETLTDERYVDIN